MATERVLFHLLEGMADSCWEAEWYGRKSRSLEKYESEIESQSYHD